MDNRNMNNRYNQFNQPPASPMVAPYSKIAMAIKIIAIVTFFIGGIYMLITFGTLSFFTSIDSIDILVILLVYLSFCALVYGIGEIVNYNYQNNLLLKTIAFNTKKD
ncbi:MAG: hypothetical protein PHH04_08045 [Thomasclavelia sp.]|jgi:uncharacterized protein YhhL (DUF1145 family)|nr:hypothetical protein [Thomasclavelia sp.]